MGSSLPCQTRSRRYLARIDEVKDIRDNAHAMRVYAFQAHDGQLASDATDIKQWATRRLGELMEEMRKAGSLAKPPIVKGPGRGKKGKTSGFLKPRGFTSKRSLDARA